MGSVYYTMACITPRMNKAVCRRGGETLNFIFAEIKKEYHQGCVCSDNHIRRLLLLRPFLRACFYRTERFTVYGNSKNL